MPNVNGPLLPAKQQAPDFKMP